MPQNSIMPIHSLLISPEKTFHLPVYAEQMASAFAEFGGSKPKRRKDTYALNVLQYVDVSASEGRESSGSSTDSDSATESTVT
jgi:hypothetical protein